MQIYEHLSTYEDDNGGFTWIYAIKLWESLKNKKNIEIIM